jgi:hypothetical protein
MLAGCVWPKRSGPATQDHTPTRGRSELRLFSELSHESVNENVKFNLNLASNGGVAACPLLVSSVTPG